MFHFYIIGYNKEMEEAFKHRKLDLTDKAFRIGLYLKGLDGLLETIAGLALLFTSTGQINSLVERLTHGEMSSDPHDFIANHLVTSAHHLTGSSLLFASAYLLSHGLVKLVLVEEVLRNRLWAYPGLIIVTSLFVVYQVYRMVADGLTFGLMFLTVFDLIIIYLTVKEYKRHKTRHDFAKD